MLSQGGIVITLQWNSLIFIIFPKKIGKPFEYAQHLNNIILYFVVRIGTLSKVYSSILFLCCNTAIPTINTIFFWCLIMPFLIKQYTQ